jgi:hypothetical protein
VERALGQQLKARAGATGRHPACVDVRPPRGGRGLSTVGMAHGARERAGRRARGEQAGPASAMGREVRREAQFKRNFIFFSFFKSQHINLPF